MIKEEVVWGFASKQNAITVAENLFCPKGRELVVQHVKSSNFFSDQTPVIYLVVERKVEE